MMAMCSVSVSRTARRSVPGWLHRRGHEGPRERWGWLDKPWGRLRRARRSAAPVRQAARALACGHRRPGAVAGVSAHGRPLSRSLRADGARLRGAPADVLPSRPPEPPTGERRSGRARRGGAKSGIRLAAADRGEGPEVGLGDRRHGPRDPRRGRDHGRARRPPWAQPDPPGRIDAWRRAAQAPPRPHVKVARLHARGDRLRPPKRRPRRRRRRPLRSPQVPIDGPRRCPSAGLADTHSDDVDGEGSAPSKKPARRRARGRTTAGRATPRSTPHALPKKGSSVVHDRRKQVRPAEQRHLARGAGVARAARASDPSA